MKSNTWRETTLGELADFINGDRGKNYPGVADRVDVGIPFINTGHILPSGRLTQDDMDYITSEKYNQLGSGKVRPGDIVYCLRGSTIGKTARNHYEEGAIASSLVIVRAKPEVNQDYLYYFLTSPAGQQLAKSNDNGSAQPNLSAKSLSKYSLLVPSFEEQESIVNTLNAIDNKIEVNTKLNQTLEQMAQAIFKSWFVNFDPVKAKMRGEQPEGMDAATASLFPEKLVESELGLIPEGWEVNQLSDICKNHSQSYNLKSVDEVVFVNTGDVQEGDFLHKNYSPVIGLPGQAKKAIKEDDILYSEIRPKNKRFAYVDYDVSDYVVSTKFMVIQANEKVHPRLLYMILTRQNTIDEFNIIADSRSGTFPQITFKAISNLEFCMAPREIQDSFVSQIMPMIKLQSSLKSENKHLAEMRDTLLPKLLSGEIDLTDKVNEVCEAL